MIRCRAHCRPVNWVLYLGRDEVAQIQVSVVPSNVVIGMSFVTMLSSQNVQARELDDHLGTQGQVTLSYTLYLWYWLEFTHSQVQPSY